MFVDVMDIILFSGLFISINLYNYKYTLTLLNKSLFINIILLLCGRIRAVYENKLMGEEYF